MNVDATLAALKKTPVGKLREKYVEVFGEASRSFNKQHLVKRIIWRMQALEEGDLSERARQRARELARDADLRLSAPRSKPCLATAGTVVRAPIRMKSDPAPGTLLRREYKGRMVLVKVMPHGFEYEGEVYRSLSVVAKIVTGSHWNGRLFFGLTDEPVARKEGAA